MHGHIHDHATAHNTLVIKRRFDHSAELSIRKQFARFALLYGDLTCFCVWIQTCFDTSESNADYRMAVQDFGRVQMKGLHRAVPSWYIHRLVSSRVWNMTHMLNTETLL